MKRSIIIFFIIIVTIFFVYSVLKIVFDIKKNNVVDTSIIITGKLQQKETLYNIFRNNNISHQEIYKISTELNKIFNTKNCKAGDEYKIIFSSDNIFLSFEYKPDILNSYIVKKIDNNNYISQHFQEQLTEKIVTFSTNLESSLYYSMVKNNISSEVVLKFADIFSWQIDFLTEPRNGDVFGLIWKQYYLKDKLYLDGEILAAYYKGSYSGKHYGIFFEDKTGYKDYFDLEGNSLRKEFLRAPLNYRRISSHFATKRFHPILRYFRPHLGIDYAAPTGTPVVSIGNGKIIFVGWKGGFGKTIVIRHNNVYTTTYGHLSKFHKGIAIGKTVRQGDVIGYVGSTGLATGPHLDFRIQKNGQYINFLTLKFPASKSVDKNSMPEFYKQRDYFLAQFEEMKKGLSDLKSF